MLAQRGYAEKTTKEIEETLLRSKWSYDQWVAIALRLPGHLDDVIQRLNNRVTRLETQAKESEEALRSLRKQRPTPGTREFDECAYDAEVAEGKLTVANETLRNLQNARNLLPDQDEVNEGASPSNGLPNEVW